MIPYGTTYAEPLTPSIDHSPYEQNADRVPFKDGILQDEARLEAVRMTVLLRG